MKRFEGKVVIVVGAAGKGNIRPRRCGHQRHGLGTRKEELQAMMALQFKGPFQIGGPRAAA